MFLKTVTFLWNPDTVRLIKRATSDPAEHLRQSGYLFYAFNFDLLIKPLLNNYLDRIVVNRGYAFKPGVCSYCQPYFPLLIGFDV